MSPLGSRWQYLYLHIELYVEVLKWNFSVLSNILHFSQSPLGGLCSFLRNQLIEWERGHVIGTRDQGKTTQGSFGENTVRLGEYFSPTKRPGSQLYPFTSQSVLKMSGYTEVPLIAGFKVNPFHVHPPMGK